MPPSMTAQSGMYSWFGPGGWLSKSHPGYEYRPGQLQMAQEVEAAFKEGRHLLIEAGTGTGKTLAYLIPALASGQRVVVSTGTKNLQDQLFYKDIPFLAEHTGNAPRVCYMKGRANYLCRQKLYDMELRPVLHGMDEVDEFAKIREWEERTETGDRGELESLLESSPLWPRIDARRETCTGQKCAQFDRCFITQMHLRAMESDLIVVNHHLFFADLALRDRDFGGVLPDYTAVIFDEAHELESVAGNYFGIAVGTHRIDDLCRDAEIALRTKSLATNDRLRCLKRVQESMAMFFSQFPAAEGRFGFENREQFLEENFDDYSSLQNAFLHLDSEFSAIDEKPEEIHNILRRTAEARADLAFIMENRDRAFVYWYERRGRGVFLQATPIDVSKILDDRLFSKTDTIVMTSATLAVGGTFDYVKTRLGVRHAHSLIVEPQFDYERQALLYIPASIPEPAAPEFAAAAAAEILRLLDCSRGRAFVLFTSYQQMKQVYERVEPELRYPLLLQGTAPRHVLIERFRSPKNAGAVLFATSSFWQGVDVPGEQLSCVIVDRLPFAVPNDPVVRARIESVKNDGGNPFYEYQVPDAAIALKQGFGRLIRSRSDRGVLAMLDSRIATRHYGKVFLESLPPYRVTRNIADVEEFFGEES